MRVAIGVPSNRMQPRPWQDTYILQMLQYTASIGIEVTPQWIAEGYNAAQNRNRILHWAEETGADAALLLDSDVLPPPETIERLAALNAPVASGLYFRQSAPHAPQAYEIWGYTEKDDARGKRPLYRAVMPIPDKPFPCAATGGGCLFVRREVWLELAPMPFQWSYTEELSIGEDLWFSQVVGERFGPIIVHPGVSCRQVVLGHVGRQEFDVAWEARKAELEASGKRIRGYAPNGEEIPA